MNCEHCQEQLDISAGHNLAPEPASHLEACDSCAEYWRSLSKTGANMGHDGLFYPDSGVSKAILKEVIGRMSKVHRRPSKSTVRHVSLPWLAAAAAVVIIFIGGTLKWNLLDELTGADSTNVAVNDDLSDAPDQFDFVQLADEDLTDMTGNVNWINLDDFGRLVSEDISEDEWQYLNDSLSSEDILL